MIFSSIKRLICDILLFNHFFLFTLFFRLVAFNLGYLPGVDKTLITMPHTTEMALKASSKLLDSKGLISIIVYAGHPGGR
jgi:Putative rRNA methylase